MQPNRYHLPKKSETSVMCLLCNSRSYSNYEHCTVVTVMNIQMHCLYKKENKSKGKPFNSQLLTRNEHKRNQCEIELK